MALGVIYCNPGPVYEDEVYAQIGSTTGKTVDADLGALLKQGQTWTVAG